MHADQVEDIVALDIALKRNDPRLAGTAAARHQAPILMKLYYGHFFCHVFHQDYIVRKGNDCLALEHRMWKLLDERGAGYPAEHNVGHLYDIKPELKAFYRSLDPCNQFNPGIGRTSNYRDGARAPRHAKARTVLAQIRCSGLQQGGVPVQMMVGAAKRGSIMASQLEVIARRHLVGHAHTAIQLDGPARPT